MTNLQKKIPFFKDYSKETIVLHPFGINLLHAGHPKHKRAGKVPLFFQES
jgi:hypothetical protein